MAVTTKAQIRAVLGDLLAEHGFPYDGHTNEAADDDTPWLLFHADPPDALARRHPGWFAHLAARYGAQRPTCIDIWVGWSQDIQPPAWAINGDLDQSDLTATDMWAARHASLDLWLPHALAALTTWFDDLDKRFPPPDDR